MIPITKKEINKILSNEKSFNFDDFGKVIVCDITSLRDKKLKYKTATILIEGLVYLVNFKNGYYDYCLDDNGIKINLEERYIGITKKIYNLLNNNFDDIINESVSWDIMIGAGIFVASMVATIIREYTRLSTAAIAKGKPMDSQTRNRCLLDAFLISVHDSQHRRP